MKFIFTTIAALLIVFVNAQTVKKATRQSWAGGVCCVSGVNYNVFLDTKLSAEKVSVEQVWLKGHGLISGTISTFSNEKNTLVISFGTRSNNRVDPVKEIDSNKQEDETPEFTGMALIILKNGLNKIRIEVAGFEDLMMIAYP